MNRNPSATAVSEVNDSSPNTESTAGAMHPSAVRRQAVAAIWIAVAWIAGTVVFELTAIGGETDYVKFDRNGDTFLGFFEESRPETVAPLDGDSV